MENILQSVIAFIAFAKRERKTCKKKERQAKREKEERKKKVKI